jgi:hypothetical protein
MAIEFNDYGWVDPPFEPREPKKSHRSTHIAPDTAAALARESGASDTTLIRSYLVHCDDVADAKNSLASLKRNQPALFERSARRVSQSHIRPLRGAKR